MSEEFWPQKNYHPDQPVIYVNLTTTYDHKNKEIVADVIYRAFNAGSSKKEQQFRYKRNEKEFSLLEYNIRCSRIWAMIDILKHINQFGLRRNIEIFSEYQYIHDIIMGEKTYKFANSNWEYIDSTTGKKKRFAYSKYLKEYHDLITSSDHVITHSLKKKHPEMFSFFKDKLLNV